MTGSYLFQKRVQVEFEHFAVINDPSHYQLLSCEDDDESYSMQPVDYEYNFAVQDDMSLCIFQTYRFCSYCLFSNQDNIPKNKVCALFLKPENCQLLNQFKVEIWLSFHFKLCLKRNKELYKSKYILDTACSFDVSCDATSESQFKVRYNSENINGWTVKHSLTTVIKTEKIKFFNHYTDMEDLEMNEECNLFPPRFILNITKGPNCNTNLRKHRHNCYFV